MKLRNVLACLAPVMAYSATALAFDRTWSIKGAAFAISATCAARVTITPDAADGLVSVHAHADHPEEIDRLVFEASQAGPTLHPLVPDARCWQPAGSMGEAPTLLLAVDVPAGARLAIDDAGVASYSIGAVGGWLTADLAGVATLEDEAAAAMSLDLSGATNVAFGRVDGDVRIGASGRSVVRIASLMARAVRLDLSGIADITTGAGKIGTLDIDASGAPRVSVGGTAARANLELSGAAHIRIDHPIGPVTREVSGAATVDLGG